MEIVIRHATIDDTPALVDTLIEAANWVRALDGTTMWVEGELDEHRVIRGRGGSLRRR